LLRQGLEHDGFDGLARERYERCLVAGLRLAAAVYIGLCEELRLTRLAFCRGIDHDDLELRGSRCRNRGRGPMPSE